MINTFNNLWSTTMKVNELLSESKKDNEFQIKIGSKWEDISLPAKDLDEIAEEFTASTHAKKNFDSVPDIVAKVVEYYNGPHHPEFVDEEFDVVSLKDDVLKVKFSFYNDRRERKSGTFTMMPAAA
jgi:hypothetical protein